MMDWGTGILIIAAIAVSYIMIINIHRTLRKIVDAMKLLLEIRDMKCERMYEKLANRITELEAEIKKRDG